MLRKSLFLVLAALLAVFLTSSRAQAWGAYHVGYTHVGYGGVQHYGRTAVGGYGGYGDRYGAYGARYGGAYGARYGGVYGGYHYAPSYYGGVYGGAARYGYGYRY